MSHQAYLFLFYPELTDDAFIIICCYTVIVLNQVRVSFAPDTVPINAK